MRFKMNNRPPHTSVNIRENYSSLEGLRAYAAVGIVLMHVWANLMIKPSDNILTSDKVGSNNS